jgi:integrase
MATLKLTKSVVDKLAVGETHWDNAIKGYGVRYQSETSGRVFVFNYRNAGGSRRQINIGAYGAWTEDKARREAARLRVLVDTGGDPQQIKSDARTAESDTLGAVVEAYMTSDRVKRQRLRTLKETERALLKQWAPFHGVSVFALRRRQIADHLATLANRHGPAAASRSWSCLHGCLAWAINKRGYELPGGNPASGLDPDERPQTEKARDHKLTPDEIRALWKATANGSDHSRIIRLLLLTGQRRLEWGGAEWSQINREAKTLTIPVGKAKNKQSHVVPLSQAVLDQLPEQGRSPYLFGTLGRPFGGYSRHKLALDERCAIRPWHVHDLRHTVASALRKEIGTPPHVIAEILNHKLTKAQGVTEATKIYITDRDENAMREALSDWANYVALLVTGDPKVTPS